VHEAPLHQRNPEWDRPSVLINCCKFQTSERESVLRAIVCMCCSPCLDKSKLENGEEHASKFIYIHEISALLEKYFMCVHMRMYAEKRLGVFTFFSQAQRAQQKSRVTAEINIPAHGLRARGSNGCNAKGLFVAALFRRLSDH
jgi:hypothetical protein